MGNKLVVVTEDGEVSPLTVKVKPGKKVEWRPSDSDAQVLIQFLDEAPFTESRWDDRADLNNTVNGTAKRMTGERRFRYRAVFVGPEGFGIKPSKRRGGLDVVLGEPELIVDGGRLHPRKNAASRGGATSGASKKR